MRVLGIVPARAGSKGLPSKNLFKLGDRAIWEIARDQALEAGVDLCIVSTDIPEILAGPDRVRVKMHHRPKDLAQDDTPIESVILDILRKHVDFDIFCLLNPTSPLRTSEEIRQCLALVKMGAPCAVAVYPDYHYTVEEGREFWTLNRQHRTPRLMVSGAIYAVNVERFLEVRHLILPGAAVVETPKSHALDIDTAEDAALIYEVAVD